MAPCCRAHLVLVRPRWASNLGAVARAMKNFALSRLTLVDSRIGAWADAWRMAVHAGDVLEGAVQVAELGEAIGDANFVVGTSDRPPAGARVLTPKELAIEAARVGSLTLVFGGEVNGLMPDELRRCHAVATIPTAGEQSSLNLAQAVCVFASHLYGTPAAAETGLVPEPVPAATPAPAELMHRLELALQHLLERSAWVDATRPKRAIGELMLPLWRARLSEDEVRLWLVALNKAAQR
ncbi:MAG: RNA methyltransferase [Planctomycetes bacterium]|nr:RNA methyltransferase [Planctomycetota bacterium]MCC7398045.1 RNA methyltransferase [Planctomycetota bacterium]